MEWGSQNKIMSGLNLAELCCHQDFQQNEGDSHKEAVLYNAQYRDLVRLVNYQREKLSTQQAELTKVWEVTYLATLYYVADRIENCPQKIKKVKKKFYAPNTVVQIWCNFIIKFEIIVCIESFYVCVFMLEVWIM